MLLVFRKNKKSFKMLNDFYLFNLFLRLFIIYGSYTMQSVYHRHKPCLAKSLNRLHNYQ